jgi:hypothetical protein
LARVTEPQADELISANPWWLTGGAGDLVVDTELGAASLRVDVPELFARDPIGLSKKRVR